MNNMAGSQCDPKAIEAELEEAGIKVLRNPCLPLINEVDCGFEGVIEFKGGYWEFQRAWYYWVAKGPGISPENAMELHEKLGKVVRVNGNCGCPPPSKSFATNSYHVDTQEGLNALAVLIRKLAEGEELIKKNKEQLAKATEKAIIDQLLCYEMDKEDWQCSENEWEAIQETAATVIKAFKKLGTGRRITVCEFCARNGMQDESSICQNYPASPKKSEQL